MSARATARHLLLTPPRSVPACCRRRWARTGKYRRPSGSPGRGPTSPAFALGSEAGGFSSTLRSTNVPRPSGGCGRCRGARCPSVALPSDTLGRRSAPGRWSFTIRQHCPERRGLAGSVGAEDGGDARRFSTANESPWSTLVHPYWAAQGLPLPAGAGISSRFRDTRG